MAVHRPHPGAMGPEHAALVTCYRLEALGNMTRLAIFRLLVRAGEEGLAVGDIQRRLAVPASTLSHHLQRLSHVGLMSQERRGRVLVCRADFAAIDGVVATALVTKPASSTAAAAAPTASSVSRHITFVALR